MPFARTTDPQTSHDAAKSVSNVLNTRAFIYALLVYPMTDPELINAYRQLTSAPQASDSGIRSRRAELVAEGMVEATGRKVKLPSGRYANVWVRTEVEGC